MKIYPWRHLPERPPSCFATGCRALVLLLTLTTDVPCSQAWRGSVFPRPSPINRFRTQRHLVPPERPHDDDDGTSERRRSVVTRALHLLLLFLPTAPEDLSASNLPTSTGADLSKVGTVETLIPIVALRQGLGSVQQFLRAKPPISMPPLQGLSLIKAVPTQEKDFKRLFDAYSLPASYKQKFLDQNAFLVYYTQGFDGPGRKNIEAGEDGGGGGTVNELQTLQFGARNEAWLAWEDFIVEWDYVSKPSSNGDGGDDQAATDLSAYLDKTIQAVDAYLELAPSADLQMARSKNSRS